VNEQAEALDPNTPPARLLALLETHAEDVLRNPGFELLLLEQPDVWDELSGMVRQQVLKHPLCPSQLVTWVLREPFPDPWALVRISQNETVPVALRREAFLRLPEFAGSLVENAETLATAKIPLAEFLPAEELALFRRGGVDGPVDPTMTGDEVVALASLGWTGQQLASRHPSCPAPVLEEMLHISEDRGVWRNVLSNPGLPAGRMKRFLESANEFDRQMAAANPAMSEAQFRVAAEDPKTRWAVCSNPALPVEWQAKLGRDENSDIRRNLAESPAITSETQLLLAGDTDPAVRKALLGNPRATPEARRIAEEMDAKGA
jgi:hypothetical protein